MRAFTGLLLALAASTAVFAEQAVPPTAALAFTHVNVIDATGGPLQPDMTVIVRDGHIADLGKSGDVKAPAVAKVSFVTKVGDLGCGVGYYK